MEGLTTIQRRYYHDTEHRFIVTCAGRRSRKTLIGDQKILYDKDRGALDCPEHCYFLAAPTHQQAKKIFWERRKRDTKAFCVGVNETDLEVRLLNGSIVRVVGLDKPERIEGQTYPPVKGIHITEFADCKPNIWDKHIRPILADNNGFAIIDGVGEGRNHYYDLALIASGGKQPDKILPDVGWSAENGDWSIYTWLSSDVIDDEELDSIKEHGDAITIEQEYGGWFTSMKGLAYYAFGQWNFANNLYDPDRIVHVGMDFNVNPMSAVLAHIDGENIEVFGEIKLENSNTFEMVAELSKRFDKHRTIIYPDSTGSARSSNATETDIQILTDAGFEIRAFGTNPLQKDRIACVNGYLKSASGRTRLTVSASECPWLINDLNKVQRLDDGRLDKSQEGQGLVHLTDALGYMVWYFDKTQDRYSEQGVMPKNKPGFSMMENKTLKSTRKHPPFFEG
jgi:hypothetical protein